MHLYQRQIFGTKKIGFAYYSGYSISVSAQDNAPNGIFFNPDGTKMFIVGNQNDRVYQYTLSIAWDISTATYSGVSKSVSAQDTAPSDIFFNPDGTKMYITGTINKNVIGYTLSTAWDISTATYSGGKSIVSQENLPLGLFFKSDGTKMYVVGGQNKSIFEYTLSIAWDISTATYSGVSKSVSAQDTSPLSMSFNSSGTQLYISGGANVAIYKYILSTAWDISTATYVSSIKVNLQDLAMQGVYINPSDTLIFMVGSLNDTVFKYLFS